LTERARREICRRLSGEQGMWARSSTGSHIIVKGIVNYRG